MGWFTRNDETNKEETGEYGMMSAKLKQNLSELECEEAIIQDKERFGRVRMNMMNMLRAKHGDDIANRALSRINKRIQQDYFNSGKDWRSNRFGV